MLRHLVIIEIMEGNHKNLAFLNQYFGTVITFKNYGDLLHPRFLQELKVSSQSQQLIFVHDHLNRYDSIAAALKNTGISFSIIKLASDYLAFLNLFTIKKEKNNFILRGSVPGNTKLAFINWKDIHKIISNLLNHSQAYHQRRVGLIAADYSINDYTYLLSKTLGRSFYYRQMDSTQQDKNLLTTTIKKQQQLFTNREVDLIESYALHPTLSSFEQWAAYNKEAIFNCLQEKTRV